MCWDRMPPEAKGCEVAPWLGWGRDHFSSGFFVRGKRKKTYNEGEITSFLIFLFVARNIFVYSYKPHSNKRRFTTPNAAHTQLNMMMSMAPPCLAWIFLSVDFWRDTTRRKKGIFISYSTYTLHFQRRRNTSLQDRAVPL